MTIPKSSMVLFVLLLAALTGWYISCNKPCDPELRFIKVPGRAGWSFPRPTYVAPLDSVVENDASWWRRVRGKENFHTIGRKDNFYQLSKKYNVSVPTLLAWNNRTNTIVRPGEDIYIGTPAQRDSANRSLGADSLYTYEKDTTDGTTTVKSKIQSLGPVIRHDIEWTTSVKKPMSHIYGGAGLNSMRTVNLKAAFQPKNTPGMMYTLDVDVVGNKSFEVGFLYMLK